MTVSQQQVKSHRPDGSEDAAPPTGTGAGSAADDRHRRSATVWDVSGILLLAFAMLAFTALVPSFSEDWLRQSPTADWMAGVAGVALVASVGVAIIRDRPAPRSIPGRLVDVWRDPPGDWPAFFLGFVLAAPLLGVYWTTLFTDSDSMRLVAAIRRVQRGNLDFLVQTQDSLGPHLMLGPLAALDSPEGLRIVTIFSAMLFAGVLAWVARRISGSMAAGVVTTAALLSLPAVVDQVLYLPMYTAMLTFASAGAWLAYRVIAQDAGWLHAAGAGLCLVMAQESQLVGQLFLSVPLVLLAAAPGLRRGVANVARVYACVGVVLLPRLVVNMSEGGLSHILTNRSDYWITKGYLRDIQTDYHEYSGLGDSSVSYLQQLPERFMTSLGDFGWVALALAVVALLGVRGRAWLCILGFTAVIVAAMTVKTIQPASRYFSPLWPGVVLLVGLVGAELFRRRHLLWRLLGICLVVLLISIGALTLRDAVERGTERADKVDGYREMAAVVDDGRGVIGSRALGLVAADLDTPTFGGQFLSEEEYFTYLTWPSDEAVLEVLDRHDIGWVMVRRSPPLEISYHNTWLIPHYGREARHPKMVAASPNFCKAFSGDSILIYKVEKLKLGPCLAPSPEDDERGMHPIMRRR